MKWRFDELRAEISKIPRNDEVRPLVTCPDCGAGCWARFGRHSSGITIWHPSQFSTGNECTRSGPQTAWRKTEREALEEFLSK